MRTIVRPKLVDVLMPRTRQAILAATLLHPEKTWYLNDLARHLRLRPSSLQRELAALTGAGILKSHRQGRMVYYQADPESPVFPDLQSLMAKTAGLIDVLRDHLEPLADRIAACFVFGSIARNQETSASDVDLLIIGDLGLAELALPLREARGTLGRDVNPKLYSPSEFAKRFAASDHFLTNVLQKPKLFVMGNQRVLDEITERQPGNEGAVE
jgi:DNA-binding transcriptional ArsR family regulator